MRVRIDIGLDFDGNHTFHWTPSEGPGAVDVPKSTLDRWTAEREAFTIAFLRWKRVMEEVEETLYRAESSRPAREPAPRPAPVAVAVAVAVAGARRSR